MDNRIYEAGAQPAPPPLPATPSTGFPTNGDPLGAVPATIPGAYWLYQVGEEIRSVITASGDVPDAASVTQLRDSIISLIAANAPQPTMQPLADAANIEWDLSLGEAATVTLAGNRTMSAPSNLAVGTYVLIVKQDAVGNRALAWNAAYKWPAGVDPVLSTVANAVDIMSFFCDGVSLYGSYVRGMA